MSEGQFSPPELRFLYVGSKVSGVVVCSGCDRPYIPRGDYLVCPDCGAAMSYVDVSSFLRGHRCELDRMLALTSDLEKEHISLWDWVRLCVKGVMSGLRRFLHLR